MVTTPTVKTNMSVPSHKVNLTKEPLTPEQQHGLMIYHLRNIHDLLSQYVEMYNQQNNVIYVDFDDITVTSASAVGLTPTKIKSYDTAFISCENGQLRYRLDGIAPTTAEGHLLNVGSALTLENTAQMLNFQAIAVSTTGDLKVSYGKAITQKAATIHMDKDS